LNSEHLLHCVLDARLMYDVIRGIGWRPLFEVFGTLTELLRISHSMRALRA
jgi:hypothetical protein